MHQRVESEGEVLLLALPILAAVGLTGVVVAIAMHGAFGWASLVILALSGCFVLEPIWASISTRRERRRARRAAARAAARAARRMTPTAVRLSALTAPAAGGASSPLAGVADTVCARCQSHNDATRSRCWACGQVLDTPRVQGAA